MTAPAPLGAPPARNHPSTCASQPPFDYGPRGVPYGSSPQGSPSSTSHPAYPTHAPQRVPGPVGVPPPPLQHVPRDPRPVASAQTFSPTSPGDVRVWSEEQPPLENLKSEDKVLMSSLSEPPVSDYQKQVDELLSQMMYTVTRHEILDPKLPPGVLGQGNFGIVLKAEKNGTMYAVKLLESVSQYESIIQEEVKVLNLLRHPCIVNLIEALEYAPHDWMIIVMEFVDGGDLSQALKHRPEVFTEALVRPVAFHISSALAYAHEQGAMHRDMKPANVLLRKDFLPKVADFGLGRIVGQLSLCQTVAGTPAYMAPEVLDPRGALYDCPADVYSFGLVFADMLNDSCLSHWSGDPPAEALRKRWPAGAIPPVFSPRLEALMQELVRQVPGERSTCWLLCKNLVQLASEDPMPHPLWDAPMKMPKGPPLVKTISPESAADIAGRGGYAVGMMVQVLVESAWITGRIERISSTMCPGAAQVHYVDDGREKAILVCPWEFPTTLRPVPHETGRTDLPATMVFKPGAWDDVCKAECRSEPSTVDAFDNRQDSVDNEPRTPRSVKSDQAPPLGSKVLVPQRPWVPEAEFAALKAHNDGAKKSTSKKSTLSRYGSQCRQS